MVTKKVTISLSDENKKLAEKQSKVLLGKQNISGLFVYFINEQKKRDAETPR